MFIDRSKFGSAKVQIFFNQQHQSDIIFSNYSVVPTALCIFGQPLILPYYRSYAAENSPEVITVW